MSDVVNLRRFRKQKKREEKEHQSQQNRIQHGTSKKVKDNNAKVEELNVIRLDGKKLEGKD